MAKKETGFYLDTSKFLHGLNLADEKVRESATDGLFLEGAKVINYAINYINQLTDQPQEISLNASMRGITIGFTTFTELTELPAINPQVSEALVPYNAILEQKGESGKYTQLLISFEK